MSDRIAVKKENVFQQIDTPIRIFGMIHVRTSPYYPQSNGKIEHWYGKVKRECIRPGVLLYGSVMFFL